MRECEQEQTKKYSTESNNLQEINSNKKQKIIYQYAIKKTNKRFGGWTSNGMKRYDEIANLVKNDRKMNNQVEIEFKDLMYQNTYGDKDETPEVIPIEIPSDIHEKLGNAYVPYNDFMMTNESPYATNEKEFSISGSNDNRNQITPDKYILTYPITSPTNESLYYSPTTQKINYQRLNNNTPNENMYSNDNSDDENESKVR